jgi:hypothetical protein
VSGTVRVLPDPVPSATVTRYVWVWLEDKTPQLSYAYASEAEARRVGRPERKRAALLELVLPRDEVLAAIRADRALDDPLAEPAPTTPTT